MIVYRFERNGIGPYVGGTSANGGFFATPSRDTRTQKVYQEKLAEKLRERSSDDRHKNWSAAHRRKDVLYGCVSKEMLRAYFRGNFKPLFRDGYRIKRYKVPDDEIINMGIEVAFPVKYHKMQTLGGIKNRRRR